MPHPKQTLLLISILTLALLCVGGGGCQSTTPIKIPLTTAALPADTMYLSQPSDTKPPKRFFLYMWNPETFTLGGTEYIMQAQRPTEKPGSDGRSMPGKLLFKTPTQEFTYDLPPSLGKGMAMELTLDDGRKYLLTGRGHADSPPLSDEAKKYVSEVILTSGMLWSAGAQTGKIPPPFQTPIALYDSNMDGFYTSGEDGIIVGPPTAVAVGLDKFCYVQPLSKYITTPNGIFEIRNLAKDGSELTVLPYRGPTARLEVIAPQKYSGQIILTSSDANLNVTVSGKAGESVTVIPGSYTIRTAVLSTPSHDVPLRYVGMSVEMRELKVEAGAKQVLVLSGPKTLEFQATMVDGNVNIKTHGDGFAIKGQAGETYLAPYDLKNPPEVYLNVDGKSTLLGKMEYGWGYPSEYSGGVPPTIDLKKAKEVTITLKVHLTDFGELTATAPLKMQ